MVDPETGQPITVQRNVTLGDYNSLSHAEAMALMSAADVHGVGTFNGKNVNINVDRITCGYCKNDGGLTALKEYMGINKLTITDRLGNVVDHF